jgi:hypothetical protein
LLRMRYDDNSEIDQRSPDDRGNTL